jgi:anti-repressor protein
MEIIKINRHNGQRVVDARELHEFLGVSTRFNDWITNRISKYGFADGQDYTTFTKIIVNGGRMIEYAISLDMAKELSMVENNEKGRIARRYFIEKEKEANLKLSQISRKDLARMLYESEVEKEKLQLQSQQQQQAIEAAAPKVLFADSVAGSEGSILVREMAKILRQNGYEMGEQRLYTWLRNTGYLCKTGESYNQPTQRAMEMGLFEIKRTTINQPNGVSFTTSTTKVTGKGQIYFVNKFKGLS